MTTWRNQPPRSFNAKHELLARILRKPNSNTRASDPQMRSWGIARALHSGSGS